MIVKNTYGVSVAFAENHPYRFIPQSEFTGSAIQRKKKPKKSTPKKNDEKDKNKVKKLRSMSQRTKQKIRKKITCFARTQKRLSFVTLTFLNEVSDEQAVNTLRKFIDNVKKRSIDFQYIWVVERQTKNTVFKGNPHFHLITNKHWRIKKWWNYWITLQQKNGIIPREKGYKPSSAFDVKQVNSNELKKITSYLTKYITKNNAKFNCQVWNCSKKVSQLYTDFYTTESFLENFEKLNSIKKTFELKDQSDRPFLNIKIIEVNRQTLPLYKRLDDKNINTINNK